MCHCDDDDEPVDHDKVNAAVKLIAAVYKHDSAGGNLHCILDDDNLEMRHGALDSVNDNVVGAGPTRRAMCRAGDRDRYEPRETRR